MTKSNYETSLQVVVVLDNGQRLSLGLKWNSLLKTVCVFIVSLLVLQPNVATRIAGEFYSTLSVFVGAKRYYVAGLITEFLNSINPVNVAGNIIFHRGVLGV